MCGIAGKLHLDPMHAGDIATVRRMNARMQHRGPDGGGVHASGPVALGHRRLSIIDLDTGAQPMCNEDGSVWVVFNGEIYNFRELRSALEATGHRFKTTSDTEVIVHLYEDLGDACVSQLRGMFAFAVWDARRQRLLLARDRVGIKPLYVARTDDAVLFASEIKALLADPTVERGVDPQAIDAFLTHYYLPGTSTLLRGVERLAAGHRMTVEQGRVTVAPYWDLHADTAPHTGSFADAVERLQGLLARSVHEHMASDVPIGVLLSGGVDSTGVLAQMARLSNTPVHSFTMGFDGEGFADERPYARLAAERFGCTHTEVTMGAQEFGDYLPRAVWHLEEPVCEPPALALHFVARAARDAGVKVLLSGEGGDEAFGGYPEYRNLLLLERLKRSMQPLPLRHALQALATLGWPRGAHYAALVQPDIGEYYFSRTATPATPFNRLKPQLYQAGFAESLSPALRSSRAFWDRSAGQPLLGRMLYVDTKTWLPDDLLIKADKMTMAASVELRVPLLDHRILEFAAGLAPAYKVRGWQLKRVLKAALEPTVPRAILERRKTGFPVPYARWLQSDLKALVHDTLLSPSALLLDHFDRGAVERLLATQQQGQSHAKEVFSLLVLELWLQQFTGSAAAPEHGEHPPTVIPLDLPVPHPLAPPVPRMPLSDAA